jgi:hypothetical protein
MDSDLQDQIHKGTTLKPVPSPAPEPEVPKPEVNPGFVAARHDAVDPEKGLDLLVKRSPHKGLGWYRSMKRAAGSASRFLRGGMDSLRQRLGASPRMTALPQEERHVGELHQRFEDGMDPNRNNSHSRY